MREIVGGRFALLPETVGAGGGGEVYKAVDLDSATGAHVAIKFVTGHPDDPTTKLYFQRETSTLSKLSHPNIVRLLDYGWYEDRKQHYLALAWVFSRRARSKWEGNRFCRLVNDRTADSSEPRSSGP